MIERAVPKDILKYKAKVFAGMTGRQIICMGIAAVVGYFAWAVLFGGFPIGKVRIILTAIPTLVPIAFGFVTIQEQPLEKIGLEIFRDNFLTPQVRKKETRFPELEKFERKNEVIESDGKVRKLNCDKKTGKIVVKRSQTIKTIR